jgi:hypothetical protein
MPWDWDMVSNSWIILGTSIRSIASLVMSLIESIFIMLIKDITKLAMDLILVPRIIQELLTMSQSHGIHFQRD